MSRKQSIRVDALTAGDPTEWANERLDAHAADWVAAK